jgi:hypothetical protein
VAQGIVNRLVPTSAFALGVVRVVVHGTFLISVLVSSFSALGELPATLLRPVGVLKLVPWSFYDALLTPRNMTLLELVMVVSLLLSTTGYLTSLTTKLSLVLVVFYQGLVRSFGHFNHDEMLAIYYLGILAFTPCGDAFSLDSWSSRKRAHKPGFAYGYPILLMQLLMAWAYFSSALVKLRVAGLSYLSPDNLPALAIYHSLDNMHDSSFKLAFWLPQVRSLTPFAVAAVLIWELLFPLAIFVRRLRWWILGLGVLFHISTLLLMNIFFPHQLAMYLIFIDWDEVAAKLGRSRGEIKSP